MNRKHSYRTLRKRAFSGYVLYCLQHPESAAATMQNLNSDFSNKGARAQFSCAYDESISLKQQVERGLYPNLSQLSPYIGKIKTLLKLKARV